MCKHELAVLMAGPLDKLYHRHLDDAEWASQFSLAVTMPMMQYNAAEVNSGPADAQFAAPPAIAAAPPPSVVRVPPAPPLALPAPALHY